MDPHSFFADPDPGTKKIRIRIRIQLNKICKTINSWRAFYSCKNHEILLKRKNQWSLCKFTFKNWINLQLCSIFLHFSVFIWKTFPPGSGSAYGMRIRIQEGKWIRIHADPDPQPCLLYNTYKSPTFQLRTSFKCGYFYVHY